MRLRTSILKRSRFETVVEREESGVGGEKSDRREYEKYLVLRVHDNIMFFI